MWKEKEVERKGRTNKRMTKVREEERKGCGK